MTPGDYRDGTAISYTPPPRTQRRSGLVAAGILVVSGLTLLCASLAVQQAQNPIRNAGHTVTGVVSSVNGGRAIVDFGVSGVEYVATPVPRVTGLSGISAGSTVTVFYDPADPRQTFVDKIDVLEAPTSLHVTGVAMLTLGLIFARFPPRSPERTGQ